MGSKFVVADPGLCIGCQTCMAGCVLKHSVPGDTPKPRLNLITTLSVSAPIVCHHCADAPCAAACPQGALYQDDGRVAIRQERCIGCRSCVLACPYGAVEIVTEQGAAPLGGLKLSTTPKATIIKCDLCVDREGGPACVAACPTGGLMLMDEDEIARRQQGKRKAAAAAHEALSSVPLNERPATKSAR